LEPTAAVKAAAMEPAKAATAAETKCDDLLGPDRETSGYRRAREQYAGQPLSIRDLTNHR
jgi:hypothetical protein